MASNALLNLQSACDEVADLLHLFPQSSLAAGSRSSRVLARSSIVLLSSHFERYFYSVNEEACAYIASCGTCGHTLPQDLRLVHTKQPLDLIEKTAWKNRANQLLNLVASESWLWVQGANGSLEANRILAWMKAPKPDSLIRFYRYWGIFDIFGAITRSALTYTRMRLLVGELVDKRNNIAHGDYSAVATKSDIQRYKNTVLDFCGRSDRVFSRALKGITAQPKPW